jgi:hypothetical protein
MQGRKFIKTNTPGNIQQLHTGGFPHHIRYIADPAAPYSGTSVTDIHIFQNEDKSKMKVNLVYQSIAADTFHEKYAAAGFSTSLKIGVGSKYSCVIFIENTSDWVKFVALMKEEYELDAQTEAELLDAQRLQDVSTPKSNRKFIKTDKLGDFRQANTAAHPHTTRYISTSLVPAEELELSDFYICQNEARSSLRICLFCDTSDKSKFAEKYKAAGFAVSLKMGAGNRFSYVIFIDNANEQLKFVSLMKQVYGLDAQTEEELLAIKFFQEVKMSKIVALLPTQFEQALALTKIAIDRNLLLQLGLHCKTIFMNQLYPTTPDTPPFFNQVYLQMAISCFEEVEPDHTDYKAAKNAGYELLALDETKATYDDEFSYYEDLFRFAIDADLGQRAETVVDHIYKKLCGQSVRAISQVGKDSETLIASARHARQVEAEKCLLQEQNKKLQDEVQKLQAEIAKLKQPVVETSSAVGLFKYNPSS